MENILEGNKTIATFMNVYWTDDKNLYMISDIDYIFPEHLEYHSSWDWLMPVVEKIQSIDITPPPNYKGYRIEIVVQGYVKIEGFPMHTITTNVSIEGSLIMAVWKAVVQFIQYYNTQQK